MESDTYYEGFMVKLIQRLFENSVYHDFSTETSDNLQTNLIIIFS